MSAFYDYDWAKRTLESARDQSNGKPIGCNTRLFWRGENIALRYHSTDIVTFHADGSKVLHTGGWYTVTTLQRLREYGSRHIVSRGQDGWAVWSRPRDEDPRPAWPSRTIPKPYSVPNPGEEPVDDGVGCIAGEREEYVCEEHAPVYDWSSVQTPSWHYVTREHLGRNYSHLVAHTACNAALVWGRSAHNSSWGEDHADHVELAANETYKQCPHCATFRARHAAWELAMNGGWRSSRCYSQMCEMLERFGDRKGWQDAYITEFRQVRAARAEHREWERRNLVPWHLGHLVDADGYAQEAVAKRWRRELVLIAKEERRRARVKAANDRKRAPILAKLAKQSKQEKAWRREIAENMALALANTLEFKRSQVPTAYREMSER